MKKIILLGSLMLSLSIFMLSNFNAGFCYNVLGACKDITNILAQIFLIFPLTLLFSLTTYFMPTRVFNAWWRFARVAIPIILVLTFLINSGVHHAPHGDFQNIFDIPIIIALYSIFFIGSLIQIFRGWRSK